MVGKSEKVDATRRFSPVSLSDGDLRIDRLGRRLKVSSRTIRYYEESGLLPVLPRNEAGYRIVPGEVMPRLLLILRARRLGFSLREIREILCAFDEGEAVCETTREVLYRKKKEVRRALEDLRALDEQISALLKRCESPGAGASGICPVLEDAPEPEKARKR